MESILVVERDSDELKKILDALSGEYKLSICSTQEDALNFLQHKIPGMILIEDSKPDVDALGIMEYVKHADELLQIPIIVVSQSENEDFEKSCIHLGASDFIFRPCSPVGIRSRVRRVLDMEMTKKSLRAAVSAKSAEIDEMRDMAKRDPLTKLLNRSYSEGRINEYLSERRNRGTLLMLDMDNFKDVNDQYGHIAGDELLIEFANTLTSLTRQDDIVCRLGGDEFIIFLKDVNCHAMIIEKVEQLIMTLEKRIVKPESGGTITVSMGIAVAPDDGRSFNQLYQNADKALYYVKMNNKGSYHFFSEEGTVDMGRYKMKNTQVDLEHLRSFIQEVGYSKGAYQVEYEGFKKIYRFIARCIGRTQQEVQTVLFTLRAPSGCIPDVQELMFSMNNLQTAVHESIRRGDVATNYSSSQFVVILMDSSIADAGMVADRIRDRYVQLHNFKDYMELHYDIQSVSTAPSDF